MAILLLALLMVFILKVRSAYPRMQERELVLLPGLGKWKAVHRVYAAARGTVLLYAEPGWDGASWSSGLTILIKERALLGEATQICTILDTAWRDPQIIFRQGLRSSEPDRDQRPDLYIPAPDLFRRYMVRTERRRIWERCLPVHGFAAASMIIAGIFRNYLAWN